MTLDERLESRLTAGLTDLAGTTTTDLRDHILAVTAGTPQRHARLPLQRSVYPARAPQARAGWWTGRSLMTPILRIAAVAALLLAIGVGITGLRPASHIGADPSPSPTVEPAWLRDGALAAGTYWTAPFAQPGSDACFVPPQPSCIDGADDDSIRVTFTVPEGWEGSGSDGVAVASDTAGRAALIFVRGASLAADPCHNDGTGDIPVGPSAANFVSALRNHDGLAVTEAESITLGGRPGWYVELQVPDDPTIQGSSQPASSEGCPVYRPWNPWYLAQDPGELWHLWIVDVDGVRVVVQAIDHAGTSADVRAQLRTIAESVRIDRPVPSADASPPAASLTWSTASLERDWPAPLRAEQDGPPITVQFQGSAADGYRYTDPNGDIGPSAPPWIDITALRTSGETYIDLAGPMPSPVPGPADAWIAYGVVVDRDGDGIADVRLGTDNLPAGAGHRAWRTDLHTGRTVSAAGPPYGFVGDSHFDTFYPGAGADSMSFFGGGLSPQFYAWASVIEDGRVVATDYAPDAGWLVPR